MHSSTVRSPWTLLSRVRTFTVLLVFSFSPTTLTGKEQRGNQYSWKKGREEAAEIKRRVRAVSTDPGWSCTVPTVRSWSFCSGCSRGRDPRQSWSRCYGSPAWPAAIGGGGYRQFAAKYTTWIFVMMYGSDFFVDKSYNKWSTLVNLPGLLPSERTPRRWVPQVRSWLETVRARVAWNKTHGL